MAGTKKSNRKTSLISSHRTIATNIESMTAKKMITGTSPHCVDCATFLSLNSVFPSCKDE